jgi:hypothetical protein
VIGLFCWPVPNMSQSFQNLRPCNSQIANQATDQPINQWTNKITDYMECSPSWEAKIPQPVKKFPHVMEPDGALSCSQQPTTPPARWTQSTHILLMIHFNIMLPSMLRVHTGFFMVFLTWTPNAFALLSSAGYKPCQSHPSQFDHPNIWQGVQIMKLLIVWFSPASCCFLCYFQIFSSAPVCYKN